MWNWVRHFLTAPASDTQNRIRTVELVQTVSLTAFFLTLLADLPSLAFLPLSLPSVITTLILCWVYLVTYYLARRGRTWQASFFLSSVLWIVATIVTFVMGGLNILGFIGYIIVIIIASLLLGQRAGVIFFSLSLITSLAVFLAEANGFIFIDLMPRSRNFIWSTQLGLFIGTALLLQFAFRALQQALDHAYHNERALERRAVQFQVASEIARDATAMRQMDQLLTRAVELISERFGFYHAAIYLSDESGDNIFLRSATGEAGQQMQASKYQLHIGDSSIVSYVAKTGKPRLFPESGKETFHPTHSWLAKTKSEIAVPLRISDKTIGVLDVHSQHTSAFDEQDISILQILADQLSTAIETTRLFDAAQRQLSELTMLHAVATACAQATSHDSLIEQATDIIGDAFYPDNFGVILVEEQAGQLVKHASYREYPNADPQNIPLGTGITGKVALSGEPRRLDDVSLDPAYLAVDPQTRSELCVPLKTSEYIIGVINAESRQPNAFNDADERLLTTLASQLATGIERARLHEKTQRQLAELEALRQASLHMTSNLELKPLLEAILEQAIKLVHANDAHVFLYDGQKLDFGAAIWSGEFQQQSYWDPRPEGLTYNVVRQSLKIIISDTSQHPLFRDRPVQGAIIGLPLKIGDRVLGAMNIAFARPHLFDSNEQRVLELLADQAALALANARLYAESQKRGEVLSETLLRLQELDRMKNEFIQTASHELKTPLTIMLGYAELFESGELGALTPEQQGPMSTITRRLRSFNKLLTDMLIILESEARNLIHRPIDLAQLMCALLAELQGSIAQAGLQLVSEIPPDLPLVSGISTHLQCAIQNLVSNAIKFTPAGGTISLHLWHEAEFVIVEVSDNGIGIPAEQLERVFDRFYQVDSSATRRYAGTGLGLALVKEVAEAHGGSVSARSIVDKGSTFQISLPILVDSQSYPTI
ncbi:MAG: GAF domain-containing protein [Chloroflexota bacterium]